MYISHLHNNTIMSYFKGTKYIDFDSFRYIIMTYSKQTHDRHIVDQKLSKN